jgi:hypothetical protein
MLGWKMGKGYQLKYADPPMSKRLTINKFAYSDKKALMTCDRDTTVRMHSLSTTFLSQCFFIKEWHFKEYLANVRDTADKDVGYVYKGSCHTVNLDVSKRQSLLLWPSWGECPSIFWNSLKMAQPESDCTRESNAPNQCYCTL